MPSAKGEFASGWTVLVAAVIGNGLSAGTLAIHTIGIFGPALGRDYHWGQGVITGGFLVLTICTLGAAPLAGFLGDKFGVRPVALGSALLLAPTYMAFALLKPSIPAFYLLWAAVAVLGAGTLPVTWSRALNNRFQANKGLALGISLIGTGVAGSLLKPFGFWLVDHGGWRAGYFGLGCLPLISFVVGLFLFFDTPAAKADTTIRAAAKTDDAPSPLAGVAVGEAVRGWRFWVLLSAVFLAAAAVGGVVPNLESILRSRHFAKDAIRSIVPITGVAIVCGRLGSSFLIDRVWAPLIAFVMMASATAALLALGLFLPAPPQAAFLVLIIGLTVGMEADVAAFLVARYFGARNYGGIYGLVYGGFAIGTGLGAVAFGIAFDRLHNYHLALFSSAAILMTSGMLLLSLGRYIFPYRGRAGAQCQSGVAREPATFDLRERSVQAGTSAR
jgi:predicted MFS family arabinose efflux permease